MQSLPGLCQLYDLHYDWTSFWGAGHKEQATLAAIERRIVVALPDIIDGLIARAKEGDVKAAAYLCDRIMGRVAAAKVAPVDDRVPPYSVEEFAFDQQERDSQRSLQRLIAGIGASGRE